MNKNELKETRCENLLEYLMRNAVGYENKKCAKYIINYFTHPGFPNDDVRKNLFTTRQDIEATIQELRKRCNRKIGSSTRGYWMMCNDDEKDGYEYLKNQALGKMITAIKSGVDPKVFYKALNEIKPQCNKVADGQINLEEQEIKRLSDDLQKINKEIFDINMSDHISYEDNRRWDDLLKEKANIVNLAKEELK